MDVVGVVYGDDVGWCGDVNCLLFVDGEWLVGFCDFFDEVCDVDWFVMDGDVEGVLYCI